MTERHLPSDPPTRRRGRRRRPRRRRGDRHAAEVGDLSRASRTLVGAGRHRHDDHGPCAGAARLRPASASTRVAPRTELVRELTARLLRLDRAERDARCRTCTPAGSTSSAPGALDRSTGCCERSARAPGRHLRARHPRRHRLVPRLSRSCLRLCCCFSDLWVTCRHRYREDLAGSSRTPGAPRRLGSSTMPRHPISGGAD